MRRLAALALFALLQVALGAAVIWTQRELWLTTLHVVNGGGLTAAAMLATLRTWMLESPASPA
jgi:heme A synthase